MYREKQFALWEGVARGALAFENWMYIYQALYIFNINERKTKLVRVSAMDMINYRQSIVMYINIITKPHTAVIQNV